MCSKKTKMRTPASTKIMANYRIIILCVILWFFHSANTPVTCSNNKTDLLSLLSFKAAIYDDPRGALNSWNETVHFCSWKGILCGSRHRTRVVSINLMSQGLVGSLSPHVGNLSFLRSIILQNNSFYGQIPREIARLKRLEYIEFSNNSFDGSIPRNLSQSQNLYYLNLIDNDLTGIIPPELGSLLELEALGLSKNKLSGTISPFIGNLTRLVLLSLANCGLQGEVPHALVHLQSLELLNLDENSLTGSIPSGLYNISTFSIFTVRSNQLRGTIPSDLGFKFPKLRHLDLGDNLFSGVIPVSLSNASMLEFIYLSSNNFTGPMLKDFERLSGLRSLIFSSNHLQGDISSISSLTNCTRLQVLSLFDNLLSGSLPGSIGNLSSQLSYLSVERNEVHGSIPSGIGNLPGLTRLSIEDNDLDGPIPSAIGKLAKLQEIYLGMNRFTNVLPSSLGNLSLLNHLYVQQNNIDGSIPPTLSNCSNLLTLDLSHNNLSDSVPREIMRLSSISISFNLAHNAFTGPIPAEVGSLINLVNLDLSHNRLSGFIPNSLRSCVSLQRLHLEVNSLDGEIPRGLNALKGLQDLDLSQNNLSGPIPRFLGELPLVNLNLSFNRLQDEVPILGVFENKTAVSVDGNNELCGGIADLKLPPCSSTNSKKKNFPTVLKILIPIVITGVISFTLSVCFCISVYRRRRKSRDIPSSILSFEGQFLRLSYADLLKATNGFSEANLIGAGRFGSVYKGILDDGQILVAVKVLNLHIKGASKSFKSECNALRIVRHRNLLKLLSICQSTDFQGRDFKSLVYEYKSKGSLEKLLHQNRQQQGGQDERTSSLTMIQRLNIAIDIASALEYLHCGTDSSIVHGDLKPSNILLDDDMTAHVGDFGLAKVMSSISGEFPTHESSSIGIKGTIGYVPPEYGISTMISTQGDVYSYGILLLEIFTNLRPTDDYVLKEHTSLHNYVTSALPNAVMEIVDPYILSEYKVKQSKTEDCMNSVLGIGVACSKESPSDRMSITNVVNLLCKIRTAYLVGEETRNT